MRDKLNSLKNHLHTNRFRYGVATGFAAATYLHIRTVKEWNEFLKEQGVYDAFYEMED